MKTSSRWKQEAERKVREREQLGDGGQKIKLRQRKRHYGALQLCHLVKRKSILLHFVLCDKLQRH